MCSVPPLEMVSAEMTAPLMNSFTTPPLNTVSLLTIAFAALTSCVPYTWSPVAEPAIVSLPPVEMTEPESVPLTVADPPDRMVALTIVPPLLTSSVLPSVTVRPLDVTSADTTT
jgi:hypothetical protein